MGALSVIVASRLATPPTLPSSVVSVVVRDGDGVTEVARRLEAAGVVRSALAFRLWARWIGRDRTVQPGTYRYYQAFYRDSDPAFCGASPATFNASNAVMVAW